MNVVVCNTCAMDIVRMTIVHVQLLWKASLTILSIIIHNNYNYYIDMHAE